MWIHDQKLRHKAHPDIYNSELFPSDLGYTIYRRDRAGHKGGGVIIQVKSSSSQAKHEYDTNAVL